MYGLDIFSGIGGLSLALEPLVRPVAYCENERYAVGVLLSRMAAGDMPTAPVWDDVKTLTAGVLPPCIEIIYGGFPYQDISVAGRGAGLAGERSGLFFEIARLVGEIRPRFVFLENVPAIRTRGAEVVVKELARLGYDCRWGVLSAYDVGAPHKRDRWFLLAHSTQQLLDGGRDAGAAGRSESSDRRKDVADADGEQEKRSSESRQEFGFWDVEPNVGRVAHGIPQRVDRLRGLGNAVVPAQAREAFRRLMGFP